MAGAASDRGTDHPSPGSPKCRPRADKRQQGHVAGIKRQRHAVEHGAPPSQGDALAVIRHQVDLAALLHHDPLGRPVLPEV